MGDVIVGIDLGTTNSLVAVFEGGGPRVLTDGQGRGLMPSVVRYEGGNAEDAEGKARNAEGKHGFKPNPDSASLGSSSADSAFGSGRCRTIVGWDAKERAAEFPLTTVSSVKRLMGRSLADAAADLKYLSYRVVEGAQNTARVEIPVSEGPPLVVSPQEVSAEILRALKRQAEAALGVEVKKAVVTVPAYFDDAQRQATRDAGRIAGLEVVRIVNEPTAAALAYGLGVGGDSRSKIQDSRVRTIAVFDLGGGTFDISILRLTPGEGEGGTDFFQVLSTAGDTHLGGDDVDQMLVEAFLREMGEEKAAGLSAGTRQALRMAAERAKCELSEAESARVRVDLDGGVYERVVLRVELEAVATLWVERAMKACERAMRDARSQLAPEAAETHSPPSGRGSLDAVIMVGGATRMPIVRRRVKEFFGLEPYTAIDPDKVVALGAAVQAGVMSGAVKGALLLDVIPLSLGMETMGGAVAKVIFKNSTVPARATEMFSTSVDGQTSIKVHVLQGEREMAADCRSLGVFHLRGLPPMPAGIPQVEVEFLVDANGVLNVSAHERRSGRRAALQVVPNHGLTREEVDRMEGAALTHAREDMTRHRITDLIVNSKLDLKWIGERLERYEGKLEKGYAEDLKSQISNLRAMVGAAERDWKSVDADAFFRAKDGLDRASVRLQEVGIAESLKEERPDRS